MVGSQMINSSKVLQEVVVIVEDVLDRNYWLSPSKITAIVRLKLTSLSLGIEPTNVTVGGSPNSHFISIWYQDSFYIACISDEVRHQLLIQEFKSNGFLGSDTIAYEKWTIFHVIASEEYLKYRFNLPLVYLINLFNREMYPTPRLTLGIGYIASYLRNTNLADVEISDWQFENEEDDCYLFLETYRPPIVGMSVNFGQITLLDKVISFIKEIKNYNPIVVLGNVLPALSYQQILQKYSNIIVCSKEGELTMADIATSYREGFSYGQISGIRYFDSRANTILTNPSKKMDIDILPVPALDKIDMLFEKEGVVTYEFSRGCQYNVCSFCPRAHKGARYFRMSAERLMWHWKYLVKVFSDFDQEKYIFLADEEFLGGESSVIDLQNFVNTNPTLLQSHYLKFDTSCRGDQVFALEKSDTWNYSRIALFRKLLNIGLNRLFLGVESGSDSQLKRYKKGYNTTEIVSSIRAFSVLGVRLRFGFILFDPLMNWMELIENIEFLGRDDVVLKKSSLSDEEIIQLLKSDKIDTNKIENEGRVYENVSYMASGLEVLLKSSYFRLVKNDYEYLIVEEDINFARVKCKYINSSIGEIKEICSRWINICFPIVYSIKGLRKKANKQDSVILRSLLRKHREISYKLIVWLSYIKVNDETLKKRIEKIIANDNKDYLLNSLDSANSAKYIIKNTFTEFNNSVFDVINAGLITDDNIRSLLISIYDNWVKEVNIELISSEREM